MSDCLRLPDPFYSYNKGEVVFAESRHIPRDWIQFFTILKLMLANLNASPNSFFLIHTTVKGLQT